jgi:uncharacterized protein (DUF2225 family)
LINISSIKNISLIKKCSPGTVITGEGSANLLFVVAKGEVGVYQQYKTPKAQKVRTLVSGDLFADPGLLRDQPAAYATVSHDEAIIIPIEKRAVHDFLQKEPALAFEILKELFLRLEESESPGANAQRTGAGAERDTGAADDGGPAAQNPPEASAVDEPQAVGALPRHAPPASGAPAAGRKSSALFPPGHGTYTLPLTDPDDALLMDKNEQCPVCESVFTARVVRPSKLAIISTDPDLRCRYKGIEPLYYEVLTCPHCLYSALHDQFESPEKPKKDILKALEALKSTVDISIGPPKTTESIFAGYYLALSCAPIAFSKHQLTEAKIQYKLSRIYADAGDPEMENQTAAKALENYLYAYTHIDIPPSQEQQICVLMGELYFKQNDLKNAYDFFTKARSGENPALKKHAENRIFDIRDAQKK